MSIFQVALPSGFGMDVISIDHPSSLTVSIEGAVSLGVDGQDGAPGPPGPAGAVSSRVSVLEGGFAYGGGNAVKSSMGGGRWSVALMGDTGTEDYIRAGFEIPEGWSSVNVKMTYATATVGGPGQNVRCWTYVSVAELGGNLAANRTQGFLDFDASLAGDIPAQVDVFNAVAVVPGELLSVTIGRNSNNASDTFAGGTIGVLVVAIEQAD